MKNSKFILLIKTFNQEEWRRFGDFLDSPFHNKNKRLRSFYNYLKNVAPLFEEKKLQKLVLHKKIFQNQPFDQKALDDFIYQLQKQLEKFVLLLRLEQEKATGNLLILEAFMERKLEKHYRAYFKKSITFLEKNKQQDSRYYLYQYQLSDIAKRNFVAQKQRKYDPNLQASIDNLDQFYFFNKLKATCEMLEWKNIITANFKFSFTEEVVEHLKNNEATLSPIMAAYLSAYYLLTKEDAATDFIQLKKILQENRHFFSNLEKNYLYLFAINYCGIQMRQNNNVTFYIGECLALYLEGVEQRFFYINGYLSPWTFKNIVTLGFNLKKFDWTANFIQTYHIHLEKGFQKDALHYNMADLNYRKQNYREAQSHLLQIQYSDIFYGLGAKSMLLKIYFETNEEEALFSLIASFTIYLKRNKKIAPNIRQIYLNFTSLMYQLLKAKPHQLPIIQEKIRTSEPLTDRRWLIRISELLQGKGQR